jgi:hypothetical protein
MKTQMMLPRLIQCFTQIKEVIASVQFVVRNSGIHQVYRSICLLIKRVQNGSEIKRRKRSERSNEEITVIVLGLRREAPPPVGLLVTRRNCTRRTTVFISVKFVTKSL